jgi:hypothetical protein
MRCPPNKALGCAAGALVKPNRNIVEPPNDASSNGEVGGLVASRTKPSATIAPNETHTKRLIILSMT